MNTESFCYGGGQGRTAEGGLNRQCTPIKCDASAMRVSFYSNPLFVGILMKEAERLLQRMGCSVNYLEPI